MSHTLYAVMYLEINLISMILLLIIGQKTAGLSKMVAQRDFTNAIAALMLFFLSDTVCVIMKEGLLPFIPAVLLGFKALYFFSTTIMCFFWFVYFEHMQDSTFVKSKRRVLISSCLVWVMVILLVINVFSGILFYIDESNEYQRGSMFSALYVLSYTYVFITCNRALIGLFKNDNYSNRRMLIMLALFPIAPAGAGIVQFFKPQLPVACAALSLATLVMYLDWTDRMISVDPLTHLNNRKQLAYYYEQWLEDDTPAPMYLLMIDANKFKSINDTYGHIEGDAALVRISTALTLACRDIHKQTNIVRYGGDEFVVLINTDDEQTVEKLRNSIFSYLEQVNSTADAPYELTVCIGWAKAHRGQGLEDLIEQADELLYQMKAER